MNEARTQRIAALLSQTGAAHGIYEEGELNGVYDQSWPAWYAAYLVEHGLGDLLQHTLPASQVGALLEHYDRDYKQARPAESWPEYYAQRFVAQFAIHSAPERNTPMPAETSKTIVRRYFEQVFNGKQLELVGELFAPDAAYSIGGLPEPLHGPAAIQGAVASFVAGIPDLHMQIEMLFAEDDQVAVRYVGSGTQQGALMGIPPTGKHIFLPGIATYRVAEGKIVAGWDSADIVGLLAQLGALPMAG